MASQATTVPSEGSEDNSAPPARRNDERNRTNAPSQTPAASVRTSAGHSTRGEGGEDDWTEQISVQFEDKIGKPSREAIHSFFYPHRGDETSGSATQQRGGGGGGSVPPPVSPSQIPSPQSPGLQASPRRRSDMDRSTFDRHFAEQAEKDSLFVHRFWTTYDDIVILSIFTQLGIVFRLAASSWFAIFDDVFSTDSPLFVNLPLNCLSCFIMGLFCSGERLMEIISTRFSPPRLQQRLLSEDLDKSTRERRHRARRSLHSAISNEEDEENDDSDSDHMLHPSPSGLISPLAASTSMERLPYASEEDEDDDDEEEPQRMEIADSLSGGGPGILRRRRGGRRRRRRRKSQEYFHHWEPPVQLNQDLRDVQLLALERRIRASKCLLLFPVRKEDVDVMEHYFQEGYKRNRGRWDHDDSDFPEESNANRQSNSRGRKAPVIQSVPGDFTFDLELQVMSSTSTHADSSPVAALPVQKTPPPKAPAPDPLVGSIPPPPVSEHVEESASSSHGESNQMTTVHLEGNTSTSTSQPNDAPSHGDPLRPSGAGDSTPNGVDNNNSQTQSSDGHEALGVDQMITEVTANVSENISRLRRVNIADGWDAGTTPEAMSDDLMLGLRAGFCGALSSFSSWNSSMVNLLRHGNIGKAVVGYMLGLQLPIIAYRFGQHVAVYIFVWRCRFESSRDERRGYGIRVSMNETSERDGGNEETQQRRRRTEEETPSVRAIITAIFIMALVTQCTSLSFFSDPEHQQIALSLLFSPLGVLARWRLSKYNSWRPTFPVGTFIANILACALSGSLGSRLAGNPGPRERIALVSLVAGFGGTMSSLATFIVEILAGIDPILFRFDGMIYAALSLFWAMVTGLILSASADWADATD